MNEPFALTVPLRPGAEEPPAFQLVDAGAGPFLHWFAERIADDLSARGFPRQGGKEGPAPESPPRLVLHLLDAEHPRPYRRQAQSVFVVGLAEVGEEPPDVLRAAYPLMIRSLSNLFLFVVRRGDHFRCHFITLERGCYAVPRTGGEQAFFAAVTERLIPLATSHLVIDNLFEPDLPSDLLDGNEHTRAIARAGRRLAEWNLLPAPFPMEEILPPRDFRHVQRLFGIGGLSYGNVSEREDADRFWMSASGVDKSNLSEVGRTIQLVKGIDPERKAIRLSVPPGPPGNRVSVDAIEHLVIYREHPSVGAILHVHAWMEGIPATEINYPCGTLELAQAVAERVRAADDPARAVVGLKNHGLTITGPSLDEIFARIEGRVLRQIPMG